MARRRYELLIVYRDGIPKCRRRSDSLEELLLLRDELHESAVRKYRTAEIAYLVADSYDQERGYAEWCMSCPMYDLRGVFGDELCARCARKAAHA